MRATGQTDIGKTRSVNQDSIFVSEKPVGTLPNLFIVADGMGGHNGGDIASSHAVAVFYDHIRRKKKISENYLDDLMAAAKKANRKIFEESMADPLLFGMGTTFTACVIYENKCTIMHIGDSRAYMITQDRIVQLTTDHSFVNEMVKAGQITSEEAREHPKKNILTRVLGVDPEIMADGYVCTLEENAVILLCSDGLTNMLTDDEIMSIINSVCENKVEVLINLANQNGGFDNISAVLIENTGEI